MPERVQRTECPICQSRNFAETFAVTRVGEQYHFAKCHDCGFLFVADPPTDTGSHGELEKLYWRFRDRHNQIRRLILSRLRPGQRVLDIGCGRGEVGFLMRDDPVEYVGYEPARGLSDFGIQNGVNIVKAEFHGEQTGDAIILDNVIEHVMDPRGLIETAARALNPGGIMIVITPNVNDIRARFAPWRERNLWVPPDHINYFSSSDVRRLFSYAGLKVRRFRFEPLTLSGWKFFPRAAAETIGLSIFGHNVYAVDTPASWGDYDHPGRFGTD